MKRFVCDRCGLEILGRDEQYLALEGQWAWEKAVRDRGGEPRGIFPCMNYIRCGGEIIVIDDSSTGRWRQRLKKLFGQRENLHRGQEANEGDLR